VNSDSHLPDITTFFGIMLGLFSELLKHLGANHTGYGILMGFMFGAIGAYLKWRQVRAIEKAGKK